MLDELSYSPGEGDERETDSDDEGRKDPSEGNGQPDIDDICRKTNRDAARELGEGAEFDDDFYITLRKELYEDDWSLFLEDLENARDDKPHVFVMGSGNINDHIVNVERLMKGEKSDA